MLCVKDFDTSVKWKYFIILNRLGAHYRNISITTGNEQSFTLSRIISHPHHNTPLGLSNDIALLKLSRPASINTKVVPVCVPTEESTFGFQPQKKCYVTGEFQIIKRTFWMIENGKIFLTRVIYYKRNQDYFPTSRVTRKAFTPPCLRWSSKNIFSNINFFHYFLQLFVSKQN